MSKQRINVTEHGLSSADKQKEREIKRRINSQLHELNLAYNKCNCNTCRVSILNKLEDIVNAELFLWYETLEAPLNAGESLELEALDNSIENIAALHELIDKFNSLRKQLLNS
jgi:hypothetical protein